jgi:hypothetical protein
MEITTIGLDIAKRGFQVKGADAMGKGDWARAIPIVSCSTTCRCPRNIFPRSHAGICSA